MTAMEAEAISIDCRGASVVKFKRSGPTQDFRTQACRAEPQTEPGLRRGSACRHTHTLPRSLTCSGVAGCGQPWNPPLPDALVFERRKEVPPVIGIWQAFAGTYLAVAGVAMLASFGVPLLVAPMAWARLFCWEVPQPQQLVTFLGRSLGAFICVLGAFALKVAGTPQAQPNFFELMIWILVVMTALHVHGAIRKAQPTTETVEIGLWLVLLLLTLAFYPV